jgi:hypothetical protein
MSAAGTIMVFLAFNKAATSSLGFRGTIPRYIKDTNVMHMSSKGGRDTLVDWDIDQESPF